MEKLDPNQIENIIALTSLQEGMLFHYLQVPQSQLYFEQLSLEISGEIDVSHFEKAWQVVIETNEMLRTVFRWEKVENPVQIVLKKHKFQPRYIDFNGRGEEERKKRLETIKVNDAQEKFDLQEVPFRVTLCKIEDGKHMMIMSNHHILYDGWSTGIILKEFFKIYHELHRGGQALEFPVKLSFKEFVKWTQKQDKSKQENFWRNYLAGFEAPAELPIKRCIEKTTNAADYSIILAGNLKNKLDAFIRSNRVTLASVFYTAWGLLLQKYCGSEDVVFGTTVSGRSGGIKGIEDMVGLFINTVPLRIQTTSREKISEVVFQTDHILREREEFENTPLVDISSYSLMGRSESLFDTIIAIENYPLDNRLVPESSLLFIESYTMVEMAHYDLSIGIMPFNEIEIKFSFKPGLIAKETIENLAEHFKIIIQTIIENPETVLSQLEIITIDEKNQLLYEFNNTTAEYPKDKTIHQLFEEQVEKSSDRIALVGAGCVCPVSLTYRELNNQSGRLAGLLIEKGVLADTIIGIMIERSIEMLIGIMGILKAGGAYLPIDPGYPRERIDYMLKDSATRVLINKSEIRNSKFETNPNDQKINDQNKNQHFGAALVLNFENLDFEFVCTRNFKFRASDFNSSNLAYLIYTSGSTGKPKGIMIENRSVINFIKGITDIIPFQESDRILSLTTISFDIFGLETILPLIKGSVVIIGSAEAQRDVDLGARVMEREAITIFQATPSRLQLFIQGNQRALKGLKYLLVGGEVLPGPLLEILTPLTDGSIYNVYGPTETTIWSTIKEVSRGNTLNIGKPLANTFIYILSRGGLLQPVNVPGECFIGGDGVARGYLNKPELTAERFNRSYGSYKTYIFYKTGDLARWLPDGNLEFLGRIDNQVKIRGFRIELGEIEAQLLKHKHVNAAVVAAGEGDIPHLNAYIVLKNEEPETGAAEFKKYLSQQLPDYMIPSHFFLLEKIPLTPNGKVDMKALQASNTLLGPGVKYVSPRSDIERIIVRVWKDLLGIDKVGIHDNFFDLGGNSLSVIRLNSRLKEALPDKKDISVVTLFNHPTVASLACYLNREENEIANTIETKKIKTPLERSKIEIAVIGMAGRFPGAKTIDRFWENIKNGVESIHFFTQEELKQLGVDNELINNPDYVPAKGVLENKEYFDSFFFGYTPVEAEILDPQVRLFHECTWEALENAGYNPFSCDGAVGLYAGASPNPLWEISPFTSGSFGSYSEIWNALQFSDKDYLSTRIAYKLDLKGPCVTVQTACSTSLVAVDHACRALVSGICSIALAGGVSITFQDEGGYLYQEGTIMSPDGHCRAFDAEAKGTVGGNGVGVVVLKHLAEAEADGDTIYAVVKGFGINNDGRNKVGFTAPSSQGQSKAIRCALDMAEVNSESIGYIEAHGTGTLLGDPIEIEGLKMAFNSHKKHYCAIGSIKSNIGHLDAAAGIAGFIKITLSLYHRFIPPSLNFKAPNHQIDFENSPFYVNNELKTWENNEYPLRAGVSSFGLGGTNVHVILEEYAPGGPARIPAKTFDKLVLLSAKTPAALDKMSENLACHFEQNPHVHLADAAYTLQVGREAFAHRKMLICSDTEEAIRKLKTGETETARAKEEKHTIIFMFSGQGSQYVNMGIGLYQNEPVFRRHIDECFALLKNITGIDMEPVLYPGEGKITLEEAEEKIFQFRYTTPIKFIFEYSLAKMLMTWGIQPGAMIGHSFGEYVAACLAGVFSLADGLFLAALRGELMHGLPAGVMLSVPLSEKELQQRLAKEDELDIAAINAESLCIISGPVEAVNRCEEQLNREGHECLRLQVPKAGHSRMVAPIMAEFKQKIGKVKFNKPLIPFISCVSGTWIKTGEAIDPEYWTQHLRKPVRFADGLTTLFKEPNPVFLQSSPGKGLILFIDQHPENKPGTLTLSMVKHRKEPGPDVRHTFTQIGRLWLYGCVDDINWQAFYKEEEAKRRRIPLPAYPFEAVHYPVNKELFKPGTPIIPSSFSPKTGPTREWFYVPSWERVTLPPITSVQKQEQPILLFMDEEFGPLLKEQWEQNGIVVITVRMGTTFKKSTGRTYTLHPSAKENYDELLSHLETQGEIPSRVYHLWGLSRWDRDKTARDNVIDALAKGFYSLLFLVQAIGKQNIKKGREICIEVITAGAFEVTGEEELYPASASVYALGRVIRQEYPGIDCRCIDIILPAKFPIPPGDVTAKKRIGQLLEEFSFGSPDRVVAYRADYRWVESFKPLRLEKSQPGTLPLKEKGVYIITGGLGTIGMVLADYLAKTFKARLILTGRSNFPARQEWTGWSKETTGGNVSQQVQRLLEMEAAGAEILVIKADVSNPGQMQAVFHQAEEKFGPINGVIHAAGNVGEKFLCPLKDMGKPEAQLHFEPKIYGLLILEELLKDRAVDFCLLMSSTAALLGGLGYGAYAAANQFMDAYMYLLNRSSRTRWLSIDWDSWRMEEEIGEKALGAKIKESAITPPQGVEIFERILGWPRAKQVVGCMGDLQPRIDRWVKLQGLHSPGVEAETRPRDGAPLPLSRRPRPHLSTLYLPPQRSREKEVAEIWAELLGCEQIGVQDNFFELNGDSLKAVIAISKIHKQTDVKVPLKDFFANPTVAGVVQYIERAMGMTYSAIEPIEKKAYYPLSSAQKRLYIYQQLQPDSTAYNMPAVYRLTGNIDKEKFQGIFVKMIQRHEALRTAFLTSNGEMIQTIAGCCDFNMTYWELDEAEALARIPDLVKPFDLSRAPLLRVVLIHVQEQNYIIFVDIHHIISDRGSMEIIIDNIARFYQGENIKPLNVQYKDYVTRLAKQLNSETFQAQEKYWLNRLQGLIYTMFPGDYLKSKGRINGGIRDQEIDPGFYHKIDRFCTKHNVTKFIFLITAFQITLARKLNQWDIALGIPSAIRDHPDLKEIIGIFLNILLIRTAIDYNEPFSNLLSKNKNIVIEALDNQDYPYEMLIDKIRTSSPAKNELFSILFNYFPMDPDQKRTFPGFEIYPLNMSEISPKYDITLYARDGGERMLLSLVYKSDIYSDDSMRKLLTDFLATVQWVLEDASMSITLLTTWGRCDNDELDEDSEIDMYYK